MQEGWFKGSRSWRNNNPGNLRRGKFQSGQRDGFAYFRFYIIGFFALYWDLRQKAKGNTVTNLTGDSTLLELFEVYAPADDGNNPQGYAEAVARRLQIPTSTKLSWFLSQ